MKLDRFKMRRLIMVVLVLAVVGAYLSRLISVQIIQADHLKEQLEVGSTLTQTVKAIRGEILDRNGVPLVSNKLGYDVIIDDAALPRSTRNDVILGLIEMFEENDAEWDDNLPISMTRPFAFLDGYDNEIERLKNHLNIHQYATVEDTLYHLSQLYRLDDYSDTDARKIAGVRYEMEQRGFAVNVLYTFASDVDIDLVLQIKERNYELPGVDIQESAIRVYEMGDIAPHLIGQVGPIYAEELERLQEQGYARDDIVGKFGSELAFESDLRGVNGERKISLDANGVVTGVSETVPSQPGNSIYLTIDVEMQRLLQDALEAQIKNLQQNAAPGKGREADYGSAVVLDVKTGEVLAAATYPSYDLNNYMKDFAQLNTDEGRPLFNRALQGTYAPGSTFKPVVGTAGLANKLITTDTTVNCTNVYTRFSDYRPKCLGTHGPIALNRALSVSCNIFFYDVGWQLGIDQVDSYAQQYGLGEPTGIELYEAVGERSNPETAKAHGEQWTNGHVLQSSIGQLYAAYTPLQLANYVSTIANKGKRMEVTVVHEVRDYARQQVVKALEPTVAAQVDASAADFNAIIEGMITASRSGSASDYFGGYPITVASKTGTPETGLGTHPNSTFICFAPAENPEIAVAVVIEKGWHGFTGAPVAKAVFNEYFGLNSANAASSSAADQQAQENSQPGDESQDDGGSQQGDADQSQDGETSVQDEQNGPVETAINQ